MLTSNLDRTNFPKLKIAVSDCLRGTECRYNGGHAQDDFINHDLAPYAQFLPFCPEAPVLGTPRETIRLVNIDGNIRVRGTKSENDVTEGIQNYNHKMIPKLLEQGVDGAIVKSRSPTCGMERIKIYRPTGEWYGSQDKMGQGLFTAELQQQAPQLAVEEEGRLQDAWLRENFVMRVFTAARWREFLASNPTVHDFQVFHRDHKYLFLSKSEPIYREMGPIVAQAAPDNLSVQLARYEENLHALLACRSTRGMVINVLDHIYGYFKKQLLEDEKEHYRETLEEFREGIVPLIAVIKVLQQFLKHYGSDYLSTQVFLNPYPADLALRSKVTAYR
ncbi:hypothetical protein GHNINEIG_01973 [Hydrogenovibrio crunogenus]|uniref:DUF1722 domain-containing protein n=1 Tax=Hydrogenovibrio crunogenus TaxID=39765 RepID=A0A4V1C923_9GAMM|nr:DUF523 and DUF1722 domain-containing protein [Hydrogenovibrio crunogenus]QBZ83904.1 hypothetical protein GHNINEIG_01973 [Hydrogenovibrio crunogenus]